MAFKSENNNLINLYYKQVRKEIIPLLPERIERVLEVGCGEGNTLEFLKKTKNCKWTAGIELSSPAAEVARGKVDLVIDGNFETLELPFEPETLDLILCLDVLEHFVDPWTALRRMHHFIKPGGAIISSIPNVRNFRVLLPLLFRGEWTYTDHGILDKTHMRFFTKKSVIELMEGVDLKVDMVRSTGLEPWRMTSIVNAITLHLFKPYFEFQYLIRAKRMN